MSPHLSKPRVIFIDLLRAFAVLNMVQGHTTDTFLADSYRSFDSILYSFWNFNRGMTAPLFMISAGCVFTYLFRLHKEPFAKNPRVKRGIKRGLMLILVGYLLRLPTPFIVYFPPGITEAQWKIFFGVDVLQLIGFGLLSILFVCFLSEKLKLSDYILFSFFSVVNIVLYTIFQGINWTDYMHPFFAGYLYSGSGSNFPLFPWITYLLAGGILGSYLAKNPFIFKQKKFSLRLLYIGLGFILLSLIGAEIENVSTGQVNFWTTSPNLVIIRIGIVLIFIAVFAFAAIKLETIPKILILLGRNTLLIYIVHLIILYGSPWSLGINTLLNHSLNPLLTVCCAVFMMFLMTLMVYIINKLNVKNKALVT